MNKLLQAVLLIIALQIITSLRIEKTRKGIAEYCWTHKYNRGEGTTPICNGKLWGDRCYENCSEGLESHGAGCRTKCPDSKDWRDDGLFCRQMEISRPGFPIKFGELSDKGMFQRCESVYGSGNCEKYILIVYPKCPEGYKREGCCICRPSVRPNCAKYNLQDGIDLSCKKIYSETKPTTVSCKETESAGDDGKCYPLCKMGYVASGDMCMSVTPNGWIQCGLGNALNKKECKKMQKDKLFKLYYRIHKVATKIADNKCKGLCDVKKSIKKMLKLIKKIGHSDAEKEMIKALKHEVLLKELYEKLNAAMESKKPTKEELESIKYTTQQIVTSFDASSLVFLDKAKYPICS